MKNGTVHISGPEVFLPSGALLPVKGRITRITGTIICSTISDVRIGEQCLLRDPFTGRKSHAVVVGFERDEALMTPLGDTYGLSSRTEVIATGEMPVVPAGAAVLGRVLDAFGKPMDGKPLEVHEFAPVHRAPPPPMDRPPISIAMPTRVRPIDACLTIGVGQRVGIFGPAGTGKSTLLGALLRYAQADVVVLGLIGERGREVREFVEHVLGPEAFARAVVVVATSDRPPLERVRAADAATAIAESFRDQGKNVLLVLDSLTRVARGLREIGLAAGEPPTRRGFPPSVFSMLPILVERTGPAGKGAITAFYTILLDGEDAGQDPIADEVRGLLDGHFMLSRELASRGHYPAIDILASVSRLMGEVTDQEHQAYAAKLRRMMSKARDVELLVQVGEYEKGRDKEADDALARLTMIDALLRQSANDPTDFAETRAFLAKVVS